MDFSQYIFEVGKFNLVQEKGLHKFKLCKTCKKYIAKNVCKTVRATVVTGKLSPLALTLIVLFFVFGSNSGLKYICLSFFYKVFYRLHIVLF